MMGFLGTDVCVENIRGGVNKIRSVFFLKTFHNLNFFIPQATLSQMSLLVTVSKTSFTSIYVQFGILQPVDELMCL